MTRSAAVLTTRFGPLLVVVDDAVVGDRSAPVPGAVVMSGLREAVPGEALDDPADLPILALVSQAVADWESGLDLAALDRVPVVLPGEGFRVSAWSALRGVAPGETVSYRELAGIAGSERAARAAGSACANNPLAPFVPCHRVVRSDGQLGEYGYSPALKRALLHHEGAIA